MEEESDLLCDPSDEDSDAKSINHAGPRVDNNRTSASNFSTIRMVHENGKYILCNLVKKYIKIYLELQM